MIAVMFEGMVGYSFIEIMFGDRFLRHLFER